MSQDKQQQQVDNQADNQVDGNATNGDQRPDSETNANQVVPLEYDQILEIQPLSTEEQQEHVRIPFDTIRIDPVTGTIRSSPYWLRSNASGPHGGQLTTAEAATQTGAPNQLQLETANVRWYLWIPRSSYHPPRGT